MELQISHHWAVPKSPSIDVIQHRLSHCFAHSESLPVDFSVHDWSVILGAPLSESLQQHVQNICQEWRKDLSNIPKVVLGQSHCFLAVRNSWYIASQKVYVDQDISLEELRTALATYFHQSTLEHHSVVQ